MHSSHPRTAHDLHSWAAPVLLLVVSISTVYQLLVLGYMPATPANDLAKHAASILNFKDAFLNGQYLPVLQLAPASFPDMPLFQFYGSLMGWLGLPFLLVGLPPLVALTLAVLLARWVGAVALYSTGRLVGANPWASSLAGLAYLLTPYVISNFYGRVAVPEAIAHGVIAVLFYGVIRLFVRADAAGIAITSLAIVALSMAHPIFLLFGCLTAAVFASLLFRGNFLLLIGCVFLAGLLLAGFQWIPGFIYRGDFVSSFSSYSPFERRDLTSVSGLIGFPQSLRETGQIESDSRLYLTPGILTLPMLVLLGTNLGSPLRRAVFGSLLFMLILSYSPFDFWTFLPTFFWAVQFPYRLLSFVALLTSIGICLTLENLRSYQWLAIVILLFAQDAHVLTQTPYSSPLLDGDDQAAITKTFSSLDYALTPPAISIASSDGWLFDYKRPIYGSGHARPGVVDQSGFLLPNNTFDVGISPFAERYIRASGSIRASGQVPAYALWLASSTAPSQPLDGVRRMSGPTFSVLFKVANDARSMTLQCREEADTDASYRARRAGCSAITLDGIELIPGNFVVVADDTAESAALYIEGESIFKDGPVDLWLATPGSPELPLTEKLSLGPGNVSAYLTLPKQKGLYIIVASRYLVPALESPASQDYRGLSLNIHNFSEVSSGQDTPLFLPASRIEVVEKHGYRRVYKVNPSESLGSQNVHRLVNLELPIAFSPMIEVTQRDSTLVTAPSIHGLISLKTQDLQSTLVARFRWPWLSLGSTLTGALLVTLLAWRVRKNAWGLAG